MDGRFNGLISLCFFCLFFFGLVFPTRLDDKSDVMIMVMKVVVIFGVNFYVKCVHSTEMKLFFLQYLST